MMDLLSWVFHLMTSTKNLSSDDDVKKFCEIRYGVNFPLTSIQKIKGDSAHPLIQMDFW